MSQPFHNATDSTQLERKIDEFVDEFNECLTQYYMEVWPDEYEIGEFTRCCDESEKNLIKECYEIYRQHDKYTADTIALKAIILFYYSSQVLEYYALDEEKGNEEYNRCIRFNLTNDTQYRQMKKIVAYLATSNDEYASTIRRKVLGFQGGKEKKKKRKTVRRKTYRRKQAKKGNKSKSRKSKK